MTVNFSLVQTGTDSSLVILTDKGAEVVPQSHVQFVALRNLLISGEATQENVAELLDAQNSVQNRIKHLSDRVAVNENNELTFDGEVLDTALSRHILSLVREVGEQGYLPFVRLLEKLALNPNPLSRIHTYRWIDAAKLTITEDGDIVGYKSVKDTFFSHTSGENEVTVTDLDGNVLWQGTGYVPNNLNTFVTMKREEVDPHRDVLCSNGLHIATWDYASSFCGGGTIVKVIVDPADVVSIPSDHGDQKMRACKYKVVELVYQPHEASLISAKTYQEPTSDDLWGEYYNEWVENGYPTDEEDAAYNAWQDEAYDAWQENNPEDEQEEWEIQGFDSEEDYDDYLNGEGAYYVAEEDDPTEGQDY